MIFYFESKEDNGIAEGWNRGIKNCNWEYIQILNADDYLPNDKIKKSIEILLQYPDYAYCFGDIILTD